MTTMTSQIALTLIERVEALQRQIADVYAEARTYDGINNDRVLQDALAARSAKRDAEEEADALIRSFDFEEPAEA
jgi:uncharacterized protein (UPF0335 family)